VVFAVKKNIKKIYNLTIKNNLTYWKKESGRQVHRRTETAFRRNLSISSTRIKKMSSQELQTQLTSPVHNQIHHKFSKKQRHSITFNNPSLTKQSFKDECDINRIMARYQATGLLPNVNELPAQYLDVTGLDFQDHQNYIAGANSMFYELPSAIRAKFSNSPGEFLDFCSQEKNRPELAQLGLLRPITEPVIPNPQPNLSTAQNGSNPVQAASAA